MILCSSGAFFSRAPARGSGPLVHPDAEAILAVGPQLPADGIEVLVARRMAGHLDEIAGRLRESDLRFPVVHTPTRLGAALPDAEAVSHLRESAAFAEKLGAQVIVLHLWDLPDSDVDMDGRLAAATVAADVAADHGVELAVETIPCTYATPLRNIERVLERDPRIRVTVDTEFLAMHDELDAALGAEWLWDAVRHLHIKDYAGDLRGPDGARRYTMPGQGSIDFGALFEELERRGFGGTVSLEAPAYLPDGAPDVAALSHCLRRMSSAPWSWTLGDTKGDAQLRTVGR